MKASEWRFPFCQAQFEEQSSNDETYDASKDMTEDLILAEDMLACLLLQQNLVNL